MRLLKSFYIKDTLENSSQIIKWYESKRLFFNIVNLVTLAIGMLLIYAILPSLINFFLIPFIIVYWIILNLLYFFGWIFSMMIKKVWIQFNITIITSISLMYITLSSMVITLSICILYLVLNIP
jgi:hypothetical protein